MKDDLGLPIDSSPLGKAAFQFGPWFIAPALWAWTRYPDRMRWTENIFARVFGLLAGLYDTWTEIVPGYGDALGEALDEIRRPPSRVLDLATGTGYVAQRVKRKWPDAEVTALDISPEMLAIAGHDAQAQGLSIEFKQGNLSDLRFGDGEFDLVVQQNAMPYPEELMRVVAPRGSALLVFSLAGPWVGLAWPTLARKLEAAGAITVFGQQAGAGFYGAARKT